MLECIVDFLCLAAPPPSRSVTSQCTQDISTTVLLYMYIFICQGKYWHSNLMGQRELLVKSMSTADYRGGSKQKTLYTYLSIYPVWRALLKKKNALNISYYYNTPGPRGCLKHKEADHFIKDIVTHWNKSVKSACGEVAVGNELRKTIRFRDVFLSSIQSVKE